MRLLLAALLSAISLLAPAGTYTPAEVPDVHRADRSIFVSNPDGIIGSTDVARLNNILASMRSRLTVEPMIVAVDDIDNPSEASDFATDLFELWGLGKADRDNGLLILIVADQRKVTIRPGYGLEGALPDITCGRIIRRILAPAFAEGEYGAGLISAANTIDSIISNPDIAAEYRSVETDADTLTSGDDDAEEFFRFYLIFACIIAVGMLGVLASRLYALKKQRISDFDRYQQLSRLRLSFIVLTLVGVFIPIIPCAALFLALYMLRNRVRRCPNCSAKMKKVDEVHDNDYLTPAQDLEERIGSVDYDVWLCPDCGETDIYPYKNASSIYSECPRCHARTLRQVRQRIIQRPGATTKGRGVNEYECVNCGHHDDRYFDIEPTGASAVAAGAIAGAMLGGNRGGGGFSGGGTFGGGFGGGHTGGGGATGGW